jgi:hypothetical protein
LRKRRIKAAKLSGFLQNLEEKPGKPAIIVLGEPLAEELEVLPSPEKLMAAQTPDKKEEDCEVARVASPEADRAGVQMYRKSFKAPL